MATGGRIDPSYNGPAETDYCPGSTNYTGSTVTVSGTAKFTRRNPWGTEGAGNGGLGGALTTSPHPASEHPIRYAEVRITDPAGNLVQCGETDGTGAFSLTVPTGAVTYTLSVISRSYNSKLRASVLNRPEQNRFYSLSQTFTASSSVNLGVLMAKASGDNLGAAFNILDQFLEANEYLRSEVGNCSATLAGCLDFTVAPKVVAYWENGFNPNSYFGSSSGLSFYLPGYSRLFILGGNNGDVDNSDTDHFDNSVILHEYAHFLEDNIFTSDSPGGSHNGDRVIDPRLAWSEGWGNFFQAAVRNTAKYTDSLGNDDGTTRLIFDADLETADRDEPTTDGQGNFREFSVTRLLWDAVDANADGPTNGATDNVVSGKFNEIWAALTKSSDGFRDEAYAFRNIGHLHLAQVALNATDWSTIRTMERQHPDTRDYAQYVTTGACADESITPISTNTATNEHFQTNNRFYHFRPTSSATYTITLTYTDNTGPGVVDLDLYVYNKNARFMVAQDVIGYSHSQPSGLGTHTETVNVSLTAGTDYLINVNAYVGAGLGGTATFNLKVNGSQLCPATL